MLNNSSHMAVGDRQSHKQRRKMPSFSSSLLDAIYHSIDDPLDHQRRNAAANQVVEEEIESLRRAIMVEKWMEHYTATAKSRHLPSNSASSTDSSIFTSSETDSFASRATPKPLVLPANHPADRPPKNEGRFTRTKSRALKIYGDLKKVKEPISPGGRIANFLNSIFSMKKSHNSDQEWGSVRKSRSVKDTTASRSCLSKNPNSSRSNKSKRSVRFCPVSVIVDDGSEARGHRRIFDGGDEYYSSINASMPVVGSQFIKKNIDSFRQYEGMKHELRKMYENHEGEFDDKSCGSSDLFELENIGAYEQELPVYGTTDLKTNRAIANGLIV